jgi:hypothetical protein
MFALAITSKRERKSFNEYSGIRKTNSSRTQSRWKPVVEKKAVNALFLDTISERRLPQDVPRTLGPESTMRGQRNAHHQGDHYQNPRTNNHYGTRRP